MSIFSSYKKIFLLGFIVVILIAIPFSVYVAQKRQGIKSKAAASTTLSFDPASPTIKVGDILILNVMLDPGTGPSANQVSFVKLSISFDPSKFSADSLKPNTDSPNTLTSVLEDPILTPSKATISLSIGADPTKVVTTKTKIAILQLKALSATDTNNPKTSVTFDPAPNTQVLSIASSDQTSENVLSTTNPAVVTIASAAITPTPTTAPSTGSASTPSVATPPPSPSGSAGGGFTGGGSIGASPVCSSLSLDNLTTGTAPYSLTFTAVGSDTDGTISKVSFNFGDGPVQALTIGGGIGTSAVSSQLVHIYNTPGVYTAYAILTDNKDNLSSQVANCTKIITINSTSLAGGAIPTIIPKGSKGGLPPTGPSANILGIGAIGAIFTIIGGALLIFL